MQPRAKFAATAAGVAALVAAVTLFLYDAVVGRPTVEAVRPTVHEAFGIDRANVPAPPIEAATLDGSPFSLAALRGQVVFVNFWATWCPPCVEEMPSMIRLGQELSRRHPGKFRMVAVSEDDGWDPVKEFFAGPPFAGVPAGITVALDRDTAVARSYYCTARGSCPDIKFPETYIVDKAGKLVGYVVGPRNWAHPAALEYLEQLIRS
jgi:thiol-disulfide isomerase/thioredoxin